MIAGEERVKRAMLELMRDISDCPLAADDDCAHPDPSDPTARLLSFPADCPCDEACVDAVIAHFAPEDGTEAVA